MAIGLSGAPPVVYGLYSFSSAVSFLLWSLPTVHSKVSLSLLAIVFSPLPSVPSESHLTAELPFTPTNSLAQQTEVTTALALSS